MAILHTIPNNNVTDPSTNSQFFVLGHLVCVVFKLSLTIIVLAMFVQPSLQYSYGDIAYYVHIMMSLENVGVIKVKFKHLFETNLCRDWQI